MSSYDTIPCPVFPIPLNHSTPNKNVENVSSSGHSTFQLSPFTSPIVSDKNWNNNNNSAKDVLSGSEPLRVDKNFPSPPKAVTTHFRLSVDSGGERGGSGPVFFIGTGAQSAQGSLSAMKTPSIGTGTGQSSTSPKADQLSYTISNNTLKPILNNEENFECFADGSESFLDSSDNTSLPLPRDGDCELKVGGSVFEGVGPSSSSSGVSSLPFKRNTLLRSSLRNSPSHTNGETMGHRRCGSFRNTSGVKRPIVPVASSSALATQLYRSSSFHSSGRSSAGDGEEMYSDGSLEDEVIDLRQNFHHLEEKITVLAENQSDVDHRYSRAKQENTELCTKLFMAEEQTRDAEQRGEEKLREEQRRHKEALGRVEREKQLQIENYEIRLQSLEKELETSRGESGRYKQQLERERSDRIQLSDKLMEAEREVGNLRDDVRKLLDDARVSRDAVTLESIGSQQALLDLKRELESLRKLTNKPAPYSVPQRESMDGDLSECQSRLIELENENRRLKTENKHLEECRDELTAQVLNHGLEEGRHLLTLNHIGGTQNSLAAEFEAMSQEQSPSELKSIGGSESEHNQMKSALKEQKEVNDQLKVYIDGILLNIVENYPQLLEVKNKGPSLHS